LIVRSTNLRLGMPKVSHRKNTGCTEELTQKSRQLLWTLHTARLQVDGVANGDCVDCALYRYRVSCSSLLLQAHKRTAFFENGCAINSDKQQRSKLLEEVLTFRGSKAHQRLVSKRSGPSLQDPRLAINFRRLYDGRATPRNHTLLGPCRLSVSQGRWTVMHFVQDRELEHPSSK
jgi:hypothetical protein